MVNLTQRIERIEKLTRDAGCVCNDPRHYPVVFVKPDWSEERIREEEKLVQPVCPIHGVLSLPVYRWTESDRWG